MNSEKILTIQDRALDAILTAARDADQHECMGLLASDGNSDSTVVSAACLLPADVSTAHAEATPESLWRAAQLLRRQRLIPLGIWHSHGALSVYHSTTDDQTVVRLLPGMLEWSLRRPKSWIEAPVLTASDEAAIPLNDGRWLTLTLIGPKLPGLNASERVPWSSVEFSFDGSTPGPHAKVEGATVHLISGGVCLKLGIPDGASVQALSEDRDVVRAAHLYSLVVNRRGDKYAEMLTVCDLDGTPILSKDHCEIAVAQSTGPERVSEVRLLWL